MMHTQLMKYGFLWIILFLVFSFNGFLEAQELKQTQTLVEDLMGRKPEKRLAFIQKNAQSVQQLDV